VAVAIVPMDDDLANRTFMVMVRDTEADGQIAEFIF
jgi:hypothetical protein